MLWHSCYLYDAAGASEESQILSDLFSNFFSNIFYTWRKQPAQACKIEYLDREIRIHYTGLDSTHLEKKESKEGEKASAL